MAVEYAFARPRASYGMGCDGRGLDAAELIVINHLLDRRMIAAGREK
jgi:hypothetical protein